VQQGAVVIAERADKSKHLVAFYSSERPLDTTLQDQLAQALPEYMVPSTFHWQESLPLTANGKIDRKNLTALAGELSTVEEEDYQSPSTPTEQRLAAAWAKVLGIPEQQIGRRDNFFDRGGTSLSAVRLAVAMKRAVFLKDVTRYPILADLAELVDGRSKRPSELLLSLSEAGSAQAAALVCFPYAGGNAVNFQPMASVLRSNGLAVYAVELPGHDLAAEREPFAPMAQVVEQVVAEITRRGLANVLLWGHSSGTAFAVEAARQLQQHGVEVERVFLAAQLLGDAAVRRAAISELAEKSNADVAAGLSDDGGYSGLSELDAQHAEHVGAAYRHDAVSAHQYFADALDNPPAEKLSAPVTVIVAADDPSTAEFPEQYCHWQRLVQRVDLHELKDGGHYFLRTRPTEAAQAVLNVAKTGSLPLELNKDV
jgi:surfactin synthase thioesterase subunit